MIDDYRQKPRSKRLNIKLVSNKSEPLSAIDLTSILRKLSSLYYKTDLINSIAISLNQGIDFGDICIMRKPLNNSFSIANLQELNIFKQSELLYRHGFLQGLFSNKELFELTTILECFKELNYILYQNEFKTIYIRVLKVIIEEYYQKGFDDSINYLNIFPSKINQRLEDGNPNLHRSLKSVLERAFKRYHDFLDDSYNIRSLKKILENTEGRLLSPNHRKTARKYIEPFFDTINNNDFPVVLINEKNDFRVLCHYHFKQNSFKNPLFFDIEEVSHNSPTLISISLALNLISPFLLTYLGVLKIQKTYWEKEKAKEETKVLKSDRQSKEVIDQKLQELTGIIEKYAISDTIYNENIISEIESISSNYYKEKLLDISDSIMKEYEYLLEDYPFLIKELTYKK